MVVVDLAAALDSLEHDGGGGSVCLTLLAPASKTTFFFFRGFVASCHDSDRGFQGLEISIGLSQHFHLPIGMPKKA